MSVSENDFSDKKQVDFGDFGAITPVLKTDERRVQPVYVADVEGTSSGNSEEHKDLCGNSHLEKIGDSRWRVTLNGVITRSQLNKLKKMQPASQEVKLISNGHTGPVEFDRFTWTQTDDLNYGTFFIDGEEITEPLFKFQLQTRDSENS